MKYWRVVSIAALLAVALMAQAIADDQIVFYSYRERVFIGASVFAMNRDGSNLVNLSKRIGIDIIPLISPDKTKYLCSLGPHWKSDIFLIDVDGSNLVNLTNDPAGSDHNPRWSPDGTRIAWNRSPSDGLSDELEIFVMDSDGSNRRNLGDGFSPKWSPDGTKIGFIVGGIKYDAFVMNADGSGRRRVTNDLPESMFISWSPDGSKIALQNVVLFEFEQTKIYIVGFDGASLFELTKEMPEIDCYGADWSPDGSKIAFHTTADVDRSDIYVVNSNGVNPVNLTKHHPPGVDMYPKWSHDGAAIVFQTNRDGNGEIYLMNADGSNPANLTNHPKTDTRPFWLKSDYPTTSVWPQNRRLTVWGQIKAVVSGK